jgi:hypothetical protein
MRTMGGVSSKVASRPRELAEQAFVGAAIEPASVPVAAAPGVRMMVRTCGRWLYP